MKLNRREMLRGTAQAAVGLALTSPISALGGSGGESRIKIGACEWSLGKHDPSCMEVARKIGLDGVQVTMGSSNDHLKTRQPAVQQTYLQAARQHGVAVSGLALSETNNVPLFSEPKAAVWLLDSIPVCRNLGVKVVLVAMFGRGELRANDTLAVNRLVDLLKEAGPRAEQAGVVLGLENYLSAEDNLRILDRVASPAVQVYYDVGNSTDKGYEILKEIRLLGKHICEFHAKDGGFLLGHGRIDFPKVRDAILDIGFRGWIQIEAAAPKNLIADYRTQAAFLRELFQSA